MPRSRVLMLGSVSALLLLIGAALRADDEGVPTESFDNPERQVDGSVVSRSTDGDPEHYLISGSDGTFLIHYPDGHALLQAAEDCPNATFVPRVAKECRGPDQDGDFFLFDVQYLEYACPKDPKNRRLVIAAKETEEPCSEGGYYRERELAKDRFGERWPKPPPKEEKEEPPPEKKPPSYSTGKIHNPLGTKDCLQKRLWELWFKAFAEGKTPKSDVDIPLVPWSKYGYGADGTGTFETPEGTVIEQRPDGSCWEKPKGGVFKQICPPKTATGESGAGSETPKTGGEKPSEGKPADEKPAEQKPAEQKPAGDKSGQVDCPPGLLAKTLNDLLGSELQGICFEPDEMLGNAEGGHEHKDKPGKGGSD